MAEQIGIRLLALVYLSIAPTFAQDVPCHSAGPTQSVCQLPDGSRLVCERKEEGQHCFITYPNGTIQAFSGRGNADAGSVAALISGIIKMHQAHSANKAAQNAESAAQLSLKSSILSFNIGAYFTALGSYLAMNGKNEQLVRDEERMVAEIQQESDKEYELMSILTRDINQNGWKFYADPKRFKKIHEWALESACGWRQVSSKLRLWWETVSAESVPDSIKDALSTMKANEVFLDKDCETEEARKLLQKVDTQAKPQSKPPAN